MSKKATNLLIQLNALVVAPLVAAHFELCDCTWPHVYPIDKICKWDQAFLIKKYIDQNITKTILFKAALLSLFFRLLYVR